MYYVINHLLKKGLNKEVNDDVLVSINCITYNHEKYIKRAIESFLMQKTNFKFEIVIGEDCSTDNTKKIIEDYIKKYPNKIRMITDKENVGARKNGLRIHNVSKGKYIAVCEGDDYWTNPNKLQKQVDYMEQNPECTMVFHNAEKLNDVSKKSEGTMINENIGDKKCDISDIIDFRFIPTASIMYRKYTKDNLPEWYMTAVVGDLASNLIVTSYGYAYYINEVMSVYRVGNINSAVGMWDIQQKFINQKIERCKKFIDIFDNFNKFDNYRNNEAINKGKLYWEFQIDKLSGNIKSLKQNKYKELYKDMTLKSKLGVYTIKYFPSLYNGLSIAKAKLKKLKLIS